MAPHGQRPPSISPRTLPNGPCHFKDLNAGRDASICGCRHFWLNDISSSASQPSTAGLNTGAWCFCGHHGCFHGSIAVAEGEDLNVKDTQWTRSSERETSVLPYEARRAQRELQHPRPTAIGSSGLGINLEYQRQVSPALSMVGQLNPQNLLADYLPSTRAPSGRTTSHGSIIEKVPQTRATFEAYAPAIQGAETRQHYQPFTEQVRQFDELSATEMATPSYAGTPVLANANDSFRNLRTTLEAFNRQHSQDRMTVPAPGHVTYPSDHQSQQASRPVSRSVAAFSAEITPLLSQQIVALRELLESTPDLTATLQVLHARLEALETASFSAVQPEVSERFEHFEGRMLDVEAKVSDLEKLHDDIMDEKMVQRAKMDHRNRHDGSDSQESVHDVEEHAIRMDTFETRLAKHDESLASHQEQLNGLLATASPSTAAPWEVEVVFLPFSKDLTWLWSQDPLSRSRASSRSTQGVDTSVLGTQSVDTCVDQDMEWTATSVDGLVAKACGPSPGTAGIVYERLRSRGFVKTILIKANSARHIFSNIMSTMRDVIPRSHSTEPDSPLGLQGPYVPLRKVHRSSALRFLAPSELTTPATWTAEYLHANVFMRAPSKGIRRLFITEPAAYLQHMAQPRNWTWSKIREMPRHIDDDASPSQVKEADALEPCWAHGKRIDPPPKLDVSNSSGLSYHTSFDSLPSPQDTGISSPPSASSPRMEIDDDAGPALKTVSSGLSEESGSARSISSSESVDGAELPSPRSHIASQHADSERVRTISLPSQSLARTTAAKRASRSFNAMSPVKVSAAISKRRRISQSPDDVSLMGLWDLTPRRSREPSSPRASVVNTVKTLTWSRRHSSHGRMAAAGALYATPYSGGYAEFEPVLADVAMYEDGSEEMGDAGSDSFDSDNEDMSVDMEMELDFEESQEEETEEDGDGNEMMSESEEDDEPPRRRDDAWEEMTEDEQRKGSSQKNVEMSSPFEEEDGDDDLEI